MLCQLIEKPCSPNVARSGVVQDMDFPDPEANLSIGGGKHLRLSYTPDVQAPQRALGHGSESAHLLGWYLRSGCLCDRVLRTVAITQGLITYGDLSLRYAALTGATPPSGRTAWDGALREINQRLFDADPSAPTISALVVYNPPRYPEPHSSSWYYAPARPIRNRREPSRTHECA